MVWVRSPVYFYKRNETFYFSRSVSSDLRHRFNKNKIEVSLRTKSEVKAAKSAAALSEKLERYWDSIRMEMIYSRELGFSVVPDKVRNANETEVTLSDALALYQRLKGIGKSKLFFEVSNRSIRYLVECVGHDNINGLEPVDAGRFGDFLFDRGMPSSSIKRIFSSVREIINLAIKEHGLAVTNVFNGTFIPQDNKRKERLPVPINVIRQIQEECRSLNDEPRWLRTGDLGRMDEDGYVFVTGRLKELIIKGGENIAPREIDEALYEHPDVVEAAAFARPCSQYGERVEAAVRLSETSQATSDELLALCVEKVGAFKAPNHVHIINELPKGPSGKIQRLYLNELLHKS